MAATRECFSVEQVIEEVCSSGDTSELDGPQLSVEDVLKLSLENFRSLRPSVVNYSEFQEEVSRQLLNVYSRHKIGVHGTEKVLLSSLPARPMVSCEVSLWLRGVKRRMLANPKARNPWTIEIKRDLPEELFSCLMMSIRGAPSAFGVSVEDTGIKYTHKNRFLRDFSKFAGIPQSEVLNNLKKTFGGKRKGFKAEVLVSREKPFIISYDCKRKQVALACNYGCWNEFGYGFHG